MSRNRFEGTDRRDRNRDRFQSGDADFRRAKPKTKPRDKEYGHAKFADNPDWMPDDIDSLYK
jgi:hypothetical protein